MKKLWIALLSLGATPCAAETVSFSYAPYPLLEQFSKKGPQALVYVENRAPVYLLQRFVLDGKSETEWTEALELLHTQRKSAAKSVAAWFQAFKATGDASCPSSWTTIAEDKSSVTFERVSRDCPPLAAQTALYRVFYGKREVIAMTATYKGAMNSEKRRQWLAVLASAELRN